MKRTELNFLIDIVAFIGFVVLTTTGVLMRYILPPGSGHYTTIWGLDRHAWGDIHFWVAVVFFSILVLHLVLHWAWVVQVVAHKPREGSGFRAGIGIVGLVAIIAIASSPLFTPVSKEKISAPRSETTSQQHFTPLIQGYLTLREVEEYAGVPATYIIESLQLPNSISVDEKLGHLKSTYGFEMNEVRTIVEEYNN